MSPEKNKQDSPLKLRDDIATLLRIHDPSAAERFLRVFPSQSNENFSQQIQRLNRFWRAQLCELEVSTIGERDHLVDVCQLNDWIRLFKRGVLPTIRNYNLPML